MAALSDYTSRALLNHITGKSAMPALVTPVYLALFTATGTDAGSGFTEVSGGAYARTSVPAASWPTASGSAPATISNTAAISFPTSTAAWGTVVGFGLYDASTAGNLLVWDWLGNFAWVPFTGSVASPSVLTVPAHGFANGDTVAVSAEFGGVLPTGVAAGSYTVAGAATDTFNVATAATATGAGLLRKVQSQVVPNNTTVSFAIGSLTLTAA